MWKLGPDHRGRGCLGQEPAVPDKPIPEPSTVNCAHLQALCEAAPSRSKAGEHQLCKQQTTPHTYTNKKPLTAAQELLGTKWEPFNDF